MPRAARRKLPRLPSSVRRSRAKIRKLNKEREAFLAAERKKRQSTEGGHAWIRRSARRFGTQAAQQNFKFE